MSTHTQASDSDPNGVHLSFRELANLLRGIRQQSRAEGWAACRQQIVDTYPKCDDECDLCVGREDVLADLDANPYETAHE